MNIYFNKELISNYHSNSQKARILTENWVNDNMFCPNCGNSRINHCQNNMPVKDFYCPICGNTYELKSSDKQFKNKVVDGAYSTMIRRITGNDVPDFLFMNYSKEEFYVNDLFVIPKHFFIPDIIEKRRPLSQNAERAGWIGCNILINKIPIQGRIMIISNRTVLDRDNILAQMSKSNRLRMQSLDSQGWLLYVLECVNQIPTDDFCLNDVYRFEEQLSLKHPYNNNVRPKIRQQLQILRDRGFIEFLGNGNYRKI